MSDRKAKSPYQRKQKVPYKYDGVPLHQSQVREGIPRGVPVTAENVQRFEARIGLRRKGGRSFWVGAQ
jgi:hypothetical protein